MVRQIPEGKSQGQENFQSLYKLYRVEVSIFHTIYTPLSLKVRINRFQLNGFHGRQEILMQKTPLANFRIQGCPKTL